MSSSTSRRAPALQRHVQSAQRRDEDGRRAAEAARTADYYDTQERRVRHHFAWTAPEYYDRQTKEIEKYAERKQRNVSLAERRKKLEKMFYKESLEYQTELKELSTKPKLYKNGSYLNEVSTSTLKEVNQGIQAKEEELRKKEAELRMYHLWRANHPAVREAETRARNGSLKTAWMEQLIQKEEAKKKEEEDEKKDLKQRDEQIKKAIEKENREIKLQEENMMKLRTTLQDQLARLTESENAVKALRQTEEREMQTLNELRFLMEDRRQILERLESERAASLVNLGLYKHKLRMRVEAVQREIEADLDMLARLARAVVKECNEEKSTVKQNKWILEETMRHMTQYCKTEQQRQIHIDAMFDGEARQMAARQEMIWEKERQARRLLMEDVMSTLNKQVQDKLAVNRAQQRQNVEEREVLLTEIERYHREVQDKENEKQLQNSRYTSIAQLQSELKELKLREQELEEKEHRQQAIRKSIEEEEQLRRELVRLHRDGAGDCLPQRRKLAW